MKDRRDAGLEGTGMQERTDTRKEGSKKGGMRESRGAGKCSMGAGKEGLKR